MLGFTAFRQPAAWRVCYAISATSESDRSDRRRVAAPQGIELHVHGVDMLDGTPILDIKPYLSSVPSGKLRRGWLAEAEARQK